MKKFIAIVLVLLLTMAISIPAFAENVQVEENGGTANIAVYGTTATDTDGDGEPDDTDDDFDSQVTVICVDLQWDDMTFTYLEGGTRWDPEVFDYVEYDSGWRTDEVKNITVTNRSNTVISADVDFVASEDIQNSEQVFDIDFDSDSPYGSWLFAPTDAENLPTLTYDCYVNRADTTYVPASGETTELGMITVTVSSVDVVTELPIGPNYAVGEVGIIAKAGTPIFVESSVAGGGDNGEYVDFTVESFEFYLNSNMNAEDSLFVEEGYVVVEDVAGGKNITFTAAAAEAVVANNGNLYMVVNSAEEITPMYVFITLIP